MALINVGELKEGMILAEDLSASNGRLLIAKGTVINKKHVRIMNIWGVTEASVHDSSISSKKRNSMTAEQAEALRAAEKYARGLFQCCDLDHAATAELLRLKVMALQDDYLHGRRPPVNFFLNSDQAETPAGNGSLHVSDLLRREVELTSLPDIYFQLKRVIDDVSASGDHIAEVVGRDPGLASKLLKVVNSPLYGQPGKVDSLKKGVFLIGSKALIQLVLGVSIIQKFKNISTDAISLRRLWTHSIACGVIARILSSYKKDVVGERCFIGGLLHDIGRLIMLNQLAPETVNTFAHAQKNKIPLYLAERSWFNWDHALVGSELLRQWNLPLELRDMIANHHEPSLAENVAEASIIHFADIITVVCEYGFNGSPLVPPLAPEAWDALDLPLSVLAATISKAGRQIDDMLSIMLE